MSARVSLIIGGNGALGKSLISTFNKTTIQTISVDFTENNEATHHISLTSNSQPNDIIKQVGAILSTQKVCSIINVAGGWYNVLYD